FLAVAILPIIVFILVLVFVSNKKHIPRNLIDQPETADGSAGETATGTDAAGANAKASTKSATPQKVPPKNASKK
ncbi:MAG: hypothetical protein LUB61_07570, partial [Eggerthellaceae bacterium]|nr:hypothetical protein [Eggerthellaceae bacterium]